MTGTVCGMATNLRLRREAEDAIRTEAARTGQSQQELIRAAVDAYLGLSETKPPRSEAEALVATHAALPARTPFFEVAQMLQLAEGVTTLGLLDRAERF